MLAYFRAFRSNCYEWKNPTRLPLFVVMQSLERSQKISSNEYRVIVMQIKTVTAALVAAAFSGLIASSSASAQSYGGGPECGYGSTYSRAAQTCVSNGYSKHVYRDRVVHRYVAHRAATRKELAARNRDSYSR
jgi:hypothetical protein